MAYQLSAGSVAAICNDERPQAPVLQVTNVKRNQNQQVERYVLSVSDGTEQIQCVAQVQQVLTNIAAGSIIRLLAYRHQLMPTQKGPRHVIVVQSMEIVAESAPIIGNPVPVVAPKDTPVAQPQAAAPVPAPAQPAYQPPQQQQQVAPQPSYQPAPARPTPYQQQPVARPQPYQQQQQPYHQQQQQPYQQPQARPTPYQQARPQPYQQQPQQPQQQPPYQPQANGTLSRPPFQQPHQSNQQQRGFQAMANMANMPTALPEYDGDEPITVFPIASLNTFQHRWTICARISNKSPLRNWQNAKREGKVFSIDLVDNSGEIRATFFNEAADRFYPLLEVGKVYYISRGSVRQSRRPTGNNQFELMMEVTSEIAECRDKSALASVPSTVYQFVTIDQLPAVPKDGFIDLVGVVHGADALSSIMTRTTQKQLSRRNLVVVDQSRRAVNLTLWGADAENFSDDAIGRTIAVKRARVSDFGGRSLSVSSDSRLVLNPDIPEAHALRGWYDHGGAAEHFDSVSESRGGGGAGGGAGGDERRVIDDIKTYQLGMGDKPDYFSTVAQVVHIKHDGNLFYSACPTPSCGRKVLDSGAGSYHCEVCQKTVPKCEYRYAISFTIGDHTATTWVSAFNDPARDVIGVSADDLQAWRVNNSEAFDAAIQNAVHRRWVFTLRAKQETFNDETRVKVQVMRVAPLDFVAESQRLVTAIRAMMV